RIVLALQEAVHLDFFPGPCFGEVIDAFLYKSSPPIRQGHNASVGGTKSAVYLSQGFEVFFDISPVDFHSRKDLLVVLLCSCHLRLRWRQARGNHLAKHPRRFVIALKRRSDWKYSTGVARKLWGKSLLGQAYHSS